MENVPTSSAAIYPPRHSTMASAMEEARFMVAANSPLIWAPRTLFFRIFSVSFTKCSVILSSTTRVFTVFAPVMPSLKLEVIFEFTSLISLFIRISFP